MESIQLLTRKRASCTDLLTCLYDLKDTELDILFEVARSQSTLDEISEAVKKDRSTVHRALSKLVSLDLVYKRVRSLKNGGYYHVYTIAEESKIRDNAKLKVREITESLERLTDNFIPDFRKHLENRSSVSKF